MASISSESLAYRVAEAMTLLHGWNGRTSPSELAEAIRHILLPLAEASDDLDSLTCARLAHVHLRLDALATEPYQYEDRDMLDRSLLRLWEQLNENT